MPIEGKGPKDPLDRPFAGRPRSAIEQGYGYAINLPCDWIIITSMRQTRLYHKGSTHQSFERFETVALAEDQLQLEKFVFLLGAERIAPLTGRCHLYELLTASEKVGRELTKKFYVLYGNIRQDAFELLCRENPNVSRHDVFSARKSCSTAFSSAPSARTGTCCRPTLSATPTSIATRTIPG